MPLIDQIENQLIGPKSFMGGRNVEWSQDMALEAGGGGVLPNQLIALENFDVGSMGALIGRKGTTRLNSTAINSGAQVRSIYFYFKASTRTKYVMVQTGTEIGTFNLTTGAWTQIATGLDTEPMKWNTWLDEAYAFNGEGIFNFDGTTWSQLQDTDTECPDSVDGVVLDDRMFTAWDGTGLKSRVPYSDSFAVTFPGAAGTGTNFRRVRERDGQAILGMDVIGNKILCRRTKSTLWLHGSSIYSFAEEFLSEETGQVGRMTTGNKEGGLIWQGNRGIIYFDTATPKVFNNISRDTCMAELLTISRTNRDAACAIYHPKTDRYLISYPDESTPLVYVFFMNLPQMSPDGNVWFPHTVYKGITVTAMGYDDEEGSAGNLYFGTDDGFILQADSGYQDNSVDISGLLKWGYTDAGIPNQVKNFARIFTPARTLGGLSVTADVDFGKRVKTKTTKSYTPQDALVWDSGTWDDFVWGSESVGTRKTRYLKANGVRIAVQIQKDYSDKTEIHPFAIEFFPKERLRWP